MKRLVFLLVVSALSSACVPTQTASGGSAMPVLRVSRDGARAASPGAYIKHVVIVIQENRSFENLFAGWPGADAPLTGYEKTCTTCARTAVPLHETTFQGSDLQHSYRGAVIDYDRGAMDGFGLTHVENGATAGLAPYAYLKHGLIAPYRKMASAYTLADHMFPTEMGGSFTAHLDLIAGTTHVTPGKALVDMPSGDPWGCDAPAGTWTWTINVERSVQPDGPFPCLDQFRTVANELGAVRLSWKYYEPMVGGGQGSWSAFDAIRSVRLRSSWNTNVLASTPQTRVLLDPDAGQLPAVAWVTPDFDDSDHPNSQSDTGPSWVAAVVNAVGKSAYWKTSAIIVLWDDWGGWYDNVPPPRRDFLGLGIRVPCIIISPYARAGYVSHTQYEYGSVLKFIEEVFGLPPLGSTADGYTDTRANSLVDGFDFTQAPRSFIRIPAPYAPSYFLARPPSHLPPDTE